MIIDVLEQILVFLSRWHGDRVEVFFPGYQVELIDSLSYSVFDISLIGIVTQQLGQRILCKVLYRAIKRKGRQVLTLLKTCYFVAKMAKEHFISHVYTRT